LLDRHSGFLAKDIFIIGHLVISLKNNTGNKPDASGLDASHVNQGARWKARPL
jgi:hypothetical protein